MAQLLVRNLDEEVKRRLRARAERQNRSMEDLVREILRAASEQETEDLEPLGTRIAKRFAGLGLTEDIPELRGWQPRPADLSE